ncbi:MAG: hypothetical protein IPJ07_22720 [Acidobacteria bacterium]|nr:hypothetical protein [Acidobacteriota bacterium]MBK9706944.1 hypothetical protein [Acidobacteriota bacterium]
MSDEPEIPLKELLSALQKERDNLHGSYADIAQMFKEICEHPEKSWVHPVFVAGLSDLSAPNGLGKARNAGWRFLVQHGSKRNYAVELEPNPKGDGYAFAELDKGPFIDGMCDILENNEIAEKINSGKFKLTVLRLNAMRIYALWLRSDKPAKDIIIVIPPGPAYLKTWPDVYNIKGFESALKTAAKRMVKMNSRSV